MSKQPPKARPPDRPDDDLGLGDATTGVQKGRGAISNASGRYEKNRHVSFHDGWDSEARADMASRRGAGPRPEAEPSAPRDAGARGPGAAPRATPEIDPEPRTDTIVVTEPTRTIIATNDSPDVPFSQSINPYKGCEHGCIYCFARPTHAYLGLSPGLDFETRITAKPEAAAALRKELARPGYQCRVMAMGTNTDPYQPTERKLGITRQILEVLAEHDHPVGIVTKNAGILRDLDLLSAMAKKRLASVMLSVTSLDHDLAAVMEPRASRPARRLDTIRRLAEAGVPVGVLASPMIPAINDGELERILEAAWNAGARHAGWILVRLPLEIKDLFEEWLRAHFPDRADRVLELIRQTRGGKLYESTWGVRMTGTGPYAALLEQRFAVACSRLGFDATERFPLDTSQFKRPAGATKSAQLPLFR